MSEAIASRTRSLSVDRSQSDRLRVVPILGRSFDQPPYEVLRAQTLNLVKITEVSEGGSVPTLRVHNGLDVRLFLIDGQELVGAKQNRILNTDVLVPARTELKIPVSCVEQGRWRHVTEEFSSGTAAHYRTRSSKMARVHESLKRGASHDADQHEVWQEVRMALVKAEASSPTMALSAAYAQRRPNLDNFRKSLSLPDDAVGVAVFHGGQFQGLDLFDRHSTLDYFWKSLVDSYAIELLDRPVELGQPQSDDGQAIRAVLDKAIAGKWESFDSPGEGKDWRVTGEDLSASALVWEDQTVLHLQVFPRQAAADQPPAGAESATGYRPRIHRRFGPQ